MGWAQAAVDISQSVGIVLLGIAVTIIGWRLDEPEAEEDHGNNGRDEQCEDGIETSD